MGRMLLLGMAWQLLALWRGSRKFLGDLGMIRSMLARMGTPVESFSDSTGELPGLDDPEFKGPGKAAS